MTGLAYRPLGAIVATLTHVFRLLGRWLSYGLAAAIGALLFFAWLADEVLEGSTQVFDESIRSFINSHATPTFTSVMQVTTMLGSTRWLVALGVCVALAFVLAGWRRGAVLFAVTMAGAIILNLTLKLSFARARPDAFFDTQLPSSYSFPSGHALFSICFYGTLAAIITARLKPLPHRIIVWAAAALLVALIGFSRIYLGVHYPSDVLAGYASALVWVVVVALGDYMLQRRAQRRDANREDDV
jgi:undecaprenyl-diphosphatase